MARDGPDITKAFLIFFLCFSINKVMCFRRLVCVEYYADSTPRYIKHPPSANSTYRSNEQLCWRFKTLPPYENIKIKFEYFMLETTTNCRGDNVSIFDGFDNSDPQDLIGMYCGSTNPGDIVSDGRVLYLEFKSDSSINLSGFKLEFEAGYEDENDDEDKDKKKKHSLTTIIVGAIIGGLVLITGSVVFICVCASSRRCVCRSGSANSDTRSRSSLDNHRHGRRIRALSRTDRVGPGDVSGLPQVENAISLYSLNLALPSYSEPSAPPPYNGHDSAERLPSSPPPPYAPDDPLKGISPRDIHMPHTPSGGASSSRY